MYVIQTIIHKDANLLIIGQPRQVTRRQRTDEYNAALMHLTIIQSIMVGMIDSLKIKSVVYSKN